MLNVKSRRLLLPMEEGSLANDTRSYEIPSDAIDGILLGARQGTAQPPPTPGLPAAQGVSPLTQDLTAAIRSQMGQMGQMGPGGSGPTPTPPIMRPPMPMGPGGLLLPMEEGQMPPI